MGLEIVNVKFDAFCPKQFVTEDNGKVIKRIKHDGSAYCVYDASGHSKGIKCWKYKLGDPWHHYNGIGIVPKIYNGAQCKNTGLTADNGLRTNGFSAHDVIEIILNFPSYLLLRRLQTYFLSKCLKFKYTI